MYTEIVVSWTHVLTLFVRIAVYLEGANDDKSIAQGCLNDDPNPAKSYDHQIAFKAKSGALWLASFTMTRTVDTRSVSLSNIALSPL